MKIKSETVRMRYVMTIGRGEGKRTGAGKYGDVQKEKWKGDKGQWEKGGVRERGKGIGRKGGVREGGEGEGRTLESRM